MARSRPAMACQAFFRAAHQSGVLAATAVHEHGVIAESSASPGPFRDASLPNAVNDQRRRVISRHEQSQHAAKTGASIFLRHAL